MSPAGCRRSTTAGLILAEQEQWSNRSCLSKSRGGGTPLLDQRRSGSLGRVISHARSRVWSSRTCSPAPCVEHHLELVVGVDERLLGWVLELVRPDVLPELLGQLGPGQRLGTDHGGDLAPGSEDQRVCYKESTTEMATTQSKYGRRFDEDFKREVAALASKPARFGKRR